MQGTYTKAELVETFKRMMEQGINLADDYTKNGQEAGAAWHRAQVALLKELIALTEAGAL